MKTICFRRHNIILHSDVFGEKRAEDENLEKNYEKNLLSQKKNITFATAFREMHLYR